MKKQIFLFLLIVINAAQLLAQHQLKSPDEKIMISINLDQGIQFSVSLYHEIILKNAAIDLVFNNVSLSINPKHRNPKYSSVDEVVTPTLSFKESAIRNHYNQLSLQLSGVLDLNSGLSTMALLTGLSLLQIRKSKSMKLQTLNLPEIIKCGLHR